MTALLSALGPETPSSVSIFVACTIWTFAVVTIIWAIGLIQGNHSMMDGYYGFGFAIPAWIAFVASGATSQTAVVLLVLASLHGCRLGWYLAARWRGYAKTYGGDPRYLRFARETYTPGYWWTSFFVVMEPQAVIIVLIGAPAVIGILGARDQGADFGLLGALGVLVFAVGFYFETLADGQLQAFLADKPHNQGRYLDTGVWTHSRHPNYFGNTTVWWGIWIVAVAGHPAIWWTVAGPVINTIMLTKVLGSTFQDRHMGGRPEYQKLMARTRGFLPLPVRRPEVPDAAGAGSGTTEALR